MHAYFAADRCNYSNADSCIIVQYTEQTDVSTAVVLMYRSVSIWGLDGRGILLITAVPE